MRARQVAAGLWRLPFASNTLPPFDHTNGWLIARSHSAVLVDPGFRDANGLAMLGDALQAAGAERIEAVWLTHTHPDHREGLPDLLARWPDLTVVVHAAEADRLDTAATIHRTEDEATLPVADRRVDVLHTPGHSPGHVSFAVRDVGWILAGDLLAGHGSVWVGAPEGDMRAYLASLDRIAAERPGTIGPGHGEPIRDPRKAVRTTRAHRLDRERQILDALRAERSPATVAALRGRVYPDLEPRLASLAERTLVAHLEKLVEDGDVEPASDGPEGAYRARDAR